VGGPHFLPEVMSTPSLRGAKADGAETSAFHLLVTGQIESGKFGGADRLYCKYSFSTGPDWMIVAGTEGISGGLSQVAIRTGGGESDGFGGAVVWNFPIDIIFKSTNAFGWPRIVVTVFGVDMFGRNVTYGYGSMLIPTRPGTYERYIDMYAPVPSSIGQRILNFVTGNFPEYYDANFVAQGASREVTRTESTGSVKVKITVSTKDLQKFGYVGKSESLTSALADLTVRDRE